MPVPVILEPRETINSMLFRCIFGEIYITSISRPRCSASRPYARKPDCCCRQRRLASPSGVIMTWSFTYLLTGKSDPYAVFYLNGHKVFTSKTVKKTLEPEWNETFYINIVRFRFFRLHAFSRHITHPALPIRC